jgi:tRNA (cmo5U34)-methyltransferase
MDDTNADIWKSEKAVSHWVEDAAGREGPRAAQWRLMADLLPFDPAEPFTFLDLGAGTGAAARVVLDRYPNSTAILADYSAPMIAAGTEALDSLRGRFDYVEFDMLTGSWPAALARSFEAVLTSQCVHHLPDRRKEGLFGEILDHLVPGGWYFNFDPLAAEDPIVDAVWDRTNDRLDPTRAAHRTHRSPDEQAQYANHVRYMIPLARQLDYLIAAGFEGVDIYWKQLDYAIYGGRRSSRPA